MMIGQVIAQGVGDLAPVRCDTGGSLLLQTWASKRGVHVENGASVEIAVPCASGTVLDGLPTSGKKKFDLVIVWYDATMNETYNHTMTGQLLANVEQQ
ncbi:MAG: hypothetical protein V1702_05675, partial [Candidatus Woesearchaeota archaeon]